MSVRILTGDCRQVLATLPDESVHCVVTSPPYFGLRDYGVDGQIGLEASPEAFVAEMVAVFREVRRVLRKDGTVFLNLGDSYFGGGGGGGSKGSKQRTNAGSLIPGHTRAGARRAIACDTSGREPAGFQERDCLCGSLCDACRKAYRIGKSHSDARPAPTRSASTPSSSLGHTGSPSDHLPTSGLAPRAGRSEAATRDLEPVARPEAAQPLDAPSSMQREFSQQPQEGCRQSDQPSECQSCGCSLLDCAPASARMAGCICGTSATGLGSGISGRDASGSAYPHLTTPSLKPKDLIGIPWRVAFALQADGWWLRQDIIWHKPNPMPESVTDRCTKSHEYLFLLTKSESYSFDAAAIAEASCKGAAGSSFDTGKTGEHQQGRAQKGERPQTRRAREIATKAGLTDEHFAAIRSVGVTDVGKAQATQDGFGKNDPRIIALAAEAKVALGGYYREFLISETRNKRSVWTVPTAPFSEAHFATFPPDLIEPCIKAGCPTGGVVLDPFGGAGTTALVADRLGRDALLIELNPTYATMARDRLTRDGGMFATVTAEAAA